MSIETLLTVMMTVIGTVTVVLMMILTIKIYRNEARPGDKEPGNK